MSAGDAAFLTNKKIQQVLLICSGQTEWDELGRVVGNMDIPLSTAGEEYAEKIRDFINGDNYSVAYVSPSLACRETAQIVLRELDIKVKIVPELGTLNWGLWQGMWLKEIKYRFQRPYAQWMLDPLSVSMPEGESLTDLSARIEVFRDKYLSRKTKGVIPVLATPIVIAVIKILFLNAPWSTFWQMVSSTERVEMIEYAY